MIVVSTCKFVVTAEERPSYTPIDAVVIRGIGCVDKCFSGSSHLITNLDGYTVSVIYVDELFLSTVKLGVPCVSMFP